MRGATVTTTRLEAPAPPARAGRAEAGRRHVLSDFHDVAWAAIALAGGGVIAQGFANFYVITTRPDIETVRRVNRMKGRPPTQVGSITSTPARIPLAFDWSGLPADLTRKRIRDLMQSLFELGPFGFRGPAASHVPAHLTQLDDGIPTTQVIAPGSACPSNHFLAASLDAVDNDLLSITSANRSRHLTGASDEPAHWKAGPLAAERFSFHSARMPMTEVTPEALAAMDHEADGCAADLADAECDAMAYACLVAIMAAGPGAHRRAEQRLSHVASADGSVRVVTSAGALGEGIRRLDVT